ncbi:MAG: GH92 family glycosyl hydrolase [Mucinivorans sp.]
MKKSIPFIFILQFIICIVHASQVQPSSFVNPFIGTSNYGTTQPGPVVPGGMVSVSPFNTIAAEGNRIHSDNWCSTPYEFTNTWCIGFTQVNLSGVGCPDLGSLLLMPTSGTLEVDYQKYASQLYDQQASAGFYSARVGQARILSEITATRRTTRSRYTFGAGENHILFNIGKGLSTESGCYAKKVSDTEIEGFRLMGDFCFEQPQSIIPIYFVVRLSRAADKVRFWKKQPALPRGFASSMYNGIYKVYERYSREIAGDQIGVAFTFSCTDNQQIEASVGISYVSIANARENLDREQPAERSFDSIHQSAIDDWNRVLSVVDLEGGTNDQKTQFYTALYHNWIHPNTLSDCNGEYPQMGTGRLATIKDQAERMTMFSGWDVYRISPFIGALFYPERQAAMARTLMDMYRENGSLPKFEVAGQDFQVMEGDAALPYLTACYFLGLTKGINSEEMYQAMFKNALGETYVRGKQEFYNKNYYIPLLAKFDNSVSQALEFYIADWSLAQMAKSLGRQADYTMLMARAMGYKQYFDPSHGLLRPLLPGGEFMPNFNPLEGRNFEPSNGFHEGTSWNYTFAIPYDIPGLIKLFGTESRFVDSLSACFTRGYFDMSNEPDMSYPYLFSYVRGQEWRTQYWVNDCLKRYFSNTPGGLPGNDDAGTMSAWQMLSMMGIYPACPARADYIITTPSFDRVTIHLDKRYTDSNQLVIEAKNRTPENIYIDRIELDGKPYRNYFITHDMLMKTSKLTIYCTSKPKKR